MSTAMALPERAEIKRWLPPATEIEAIARLLFDGGMTNKHVNKWQAIAARMIAGYELGLTPVQSVNWIAIIGGRAVIWGDAALALVRVSGRLDGDIIERHEGEGDDRVAVCITKRKGASEPRETRFSVADAKKAKLWAKDGPWTEYPDRQLMWRARAWNLRDNFNDVLCGLGIAEEEIDIRQLGTKVDLPATLPDTAPKPVEAEPVADEAIIQQIAAARPAWLRFKGVDLNSEESARVWSGTLQTMYGVTSAKHLTQTKAAEFLKMLRVEGHQQEVKEVFGEPASTNS